MKKTNHMILIHKFLTGTLNHQEDEQLQQWLKDPAHERIFREVKTIWENAEEEPEPLPKEKKKIEREKLLTRLEEVKKRESQITGYQKKIRLRNLAMLVMVFLTALAGYVAIVGEENISEGTIISLDDQNKVILPDSSVVVLNKESSISFTKTLRKRLVVLSGEAYFNVAGDKEKPFVIQAGQAIIKVTGTSFVVKAYRDKPLQVIVISGAVEVTHNEETIILTRANDMAVVQEKLFKTINEDPNFNSWYTKKFLFDNTEFQKILHLLESHFDVLFEVENKALLNCRFSGRFQNEDSLEAILDVLSFSLDISYEQDGRKYKISGSGCKRTIN